MVVELAVVRLGLQDALGCCRAGWGKDATNRPVDIIDWLLQCGSLMRVDFFSSEFFFI